jgi:uncharacterized protein
MPLVLKMTAFYVVLNAAIAVVLAMNVIRMRYRTRTRFGDGANPEMQRAIRAHGNNTEYVPIALILLILARTLGGTILLTHAIGVPLTVGRILHALAFLDRSNGTGASHSSLRRSGMILTVLAILIGIFGCLWLVVTAPS